jgi:hypothetical protein
VPITITLPPPGDRVGPGFPITLISDFVGPLPTGSQFEVDMATDAEFQSLVNRVVVPTNTTALRFPLNTFSNGTLYLPDVVLQPGATVRVRAQLTTPTSGVIDSGVTAAPVTWDPNAMLWQVIQAQGSTGGGLTTDQAAQLQRTDQNTQEMDVNWQQYTAVTLPSLQTTLQSIIDGITTTIGEGASQLVATIGQRLAVVTQDFFQPYDVSGGETCDPVRFDASFARITGVTLLITQHPPEFRLVTPDGGWTFRDFAVLSFVRGGSLLERHGIHTLSYTVSPLPASIAVWNTGLELDILPGDYHINVDWAPGVCGRVVGEVLP